MVRYTGKKIAELLGFFVLGLGLGLLAHSSKSQATLLLTAGKVGRACGPSTLG